MDELECSNRQLVMQKASPSLVEATPVDILRRSVSASTVVKGWIASTHALMEVIIQPTGGSGTSAVGP